MHGVPADLDLSRFHGWDVIQLAIGEHQLQIILQSGLVVSTATQRILIEGHWELRDGGGALIDEAQEHAERDVYRIHRLLSRRVVGSTLAAPDSFALAFDDGLELRVFDSKSQYESFSIHPGDIVV